MIIRILGDCQYRVDADILAQLEALDAKLDADLDQDVPTAFAGHLDEMLALVRGLGTPLAHDELVPSDTFLPADGSSLEEVRALIGGAGLTPGGVTAGGG
ncbi:MAG: PspA-associated protein PspAA [Dehalococcoidia bacterium]